MILNFFFLFFILYLKLFQSILINKNYSLVLIGGGLEDNNKEIWNKIIELGGGINKAKFGIITSASENPCCNKSSSWFYYSNMLTLYGAAEVYYIPITINTKENNINKNVINHIKTLTGFFFGGGDQSKIIESFYNNNERIPSPALLAIRETLLSTGGVVAGTSAGTDCQTIYTMITGGNSYESLLYGSKTYWEIDELPDESILTAYGPGGIGLFQYGLLDTHFTNRGRQGRLAVLAMDTISNPLSSLYAYGIDENTALVITGPWNQRQGTIIGERGMFIIDLTSATLEQTNDGLYQEYHNILISRVSHDDIIQWSTTSPTITIPSYKTSLTNREQDIIPNESKDIFGEYNYEFDNLLYSLITSTATSTNGYTLHSSPQFKVKVQKIPNKSQSFDGYDLNGNYQWTYVGLQMDMIVA